MHNTLRFPLSIIIFFSLINFSFAQDDEEKDTHEFTVLHQVETTPVKSQGRSGTCWVFATTSFVETELMRMGKGEHDLSEMFTVRQKLLPMAEKYIRYHSKSNFGEGGQAHDLFNVVRKYGIVPEEIYDGKNIGEENHNHSEMTAVLQGMLDGVLQLKGKKLTPRWKDAVESAMNVYLGTPPDKFQYREKFYTPRSFADELGFNPDDYVLFTSYTHHPFYEHVILELPDNWANEKFFNIPIDEIIQIIDFAIKNGFSVAWDGDSGKDHFYRKECYAVIPLEEKKDAELTEPEKEKVITQQMRQETFDSFETTDDHLMHIVGIAENQVGTNFYYTKNSWGTKDRKYDGYWYMSEPYVRLKTIAIIVHKDAVPQGIKEKI